MLHNWLWGSWLLLLPPRFLTSSGHHKILGYQCPGSQHWIRAIEEYCWAQGYRHPPTVTLRWISALSKATLEELRPAGCTVMDRGNRKKMEREEITRQTSTARNTESFLWESKTQSRGVEKSEHQAHSGRGIQTLFSSAPYLTTVHLAPWMW